MTRTDQIMALVEAYKRRAVDVNNGSRPIDVWEHWDRVIAEVQGLEADLEQARAASQPAQEPVKICPSCKGRNEHFSDCTLESAQEPINRCQLRPVLLYPSELHPCELVGEDGQRYTVAAPPADTARADRILTAAGNYAMAYRDASIKEAEKAYAALEREVRKPLPGADVND